VDEIYMEDLKVVHHVYLAPLFHGGYFRGVPRVKVRHHDPAQRAVVAGLPGGLHPDEDVPYQAFEHIGVEHRLPAP